MPEYGVIRVTDNNDYLQHAGVKGMKWGVRKKRVSSSTSSRRTSRGTTAKTTPNDATSKKKSGARKVSIGKKFVNTIKSKKTRQLIASTAAVTSGALWVASAVLPGAGAIAANTVAAAANMVSLAANK